MKILIQLTLGNKYVQIQHCCPSGCRSTTHISTVAIPGFFLVMGSELIVVNVVKVIFEICKGAYYYEHNRKFEVA